MARWQLTDRAISRLMAGEDVEKPVVQVLGFKKISGQGAASDRYRLHISDGMHSHTFAMLATQLNSLIFDGSLENFSIIRAEKIIVNLVSDKRVLIILELTVLASGAEVKQKIGNPLSFSEGGAAPAPNTAAGSAGAGRPGPLRVQEPRQTLYHPNPAPMKRETVPSGYGIETGPSMPIHDLNPYNSSKVGIKARVTNKSTLRNYNNTKGEGKLFSMDLLDDSGEVRMTFFNQQVDTFFDLIKVGHVYYIKNFFVKPANKNFTTLKNDYELTAGNDTSVFPCSEDEATDIPTQTFNFVQIGQIEGLEKDTIVDVIGVCKRKGELTQLTAKSGKEYTKRDIVLVDKSNHEINLTLWGTQAESFEDDSNPVVAVKSAKISDYGGKSLTCMQSSSVQINPDLTESHYLRGWYDNEGINMESVSLSVGRAGGPSGTPWKMLKEANTLGNAAAHDKGDYYMSKVTVMAIKKENALYKACPEPACNKKVIDAGNGFYRCEKCNKETPDFKWRAMLNVSFADCSDNVWATCFAETAETLLGQNAQTLGPMYSDEPDQFEQLIKDTVFKPYVCKFRSKVDTYNNENRLRHTTLDMQPISYAEYAKKLINEIRETV